ncbi:MAG TPA: tetratricopeptide repeat protein [Polyangiaceae bacterium]
MSVSTIRTALGLLQDDPDHEQAYLDLKEALGSGKPEGMSAEDARALLASARRAHEARREYDAVASLLELEVLLAQGSDAEVDLLRELARVSDEELFDDARAEEVFGRILALVPGDETAEEVLERIRAKRSKWTELVTRYADEAASAAEPRLKSSLLVSASETAYRYGRPATTGKKKIAALQAEIVSRLESALEVDPKNRRAGALLERIYREAGKWEPLAALLEKVSTESSVKDEKTAGFLRLARVLAKKIQSPERAVAAYEGVLDLSPGNEEATSFLVDFFTAREMWDHLVSLYEEQLHTSTRHGKEDIGIVLQLAMVHWKMRGKADVAEPYFDKLRKAEPAHPGMLAFFRETLGARHDYAKLTQVLTDAQRSLPDGLARSQIAAEIAKLSEEGANATKAIEQWRALLRQDPGHTQARDALKRLYKQSGAYNALAELLRGELERIPAGDAESRLPLLREIAGLYREHVKSDTALLAALTQIAQLAPNDADTVRELVRVYDTLGRVRDLLAAQARLADLESEPSVKAELWRQIARRWLEQFSNVQNAMEAYEKVLESETHDAEAIGKLKELYAKRRAFKPLYDLLEREASGMEEGPGRREAWMEMAKIAAERLDRGPDAIALYKKILDESASSTAALDALEKQAERDKDFATVADALERRAVAESNDAGKLGVLQKLGAIYAERLGDHAAAMKTWRRVLEIQPGHAKALRVLRDSYLGSADYDGLTALFAESKDWEGLAEVLSNAADRASDAATKVELSFRAADVYEKNLEQPERAFRAYERVLAVRPDDERAARSLIPLYEAEEKWARLPALYEVLFSHAKTDETKLEILQKLGEVTGQKLQDRGAAFRHAQRAYELSPAREGALAALEHAAAAAEQWPAFVAALQARLESAGGEEKHALEAKIAETYATQLGRVDEAIAAYRRLVEENPDDHEAIATLDRILRSQDRRDDLRWLYETRVARANTSQKVELLCEWAVLEEEAMGAPDRAGEIYRRVLEIVPKHGKSLRALARLLQNTGSADEAVQMLERDRDQREGKERAARELEIAKLQIDLKRPGEAFAAVKRALDEIPDDAQAVALLERLLEIAESRPRAAGLLEQHYAATGQHDKQAHVLDVLIATAVSKGDRGALFDKLVTVHENRGKLGEAFDVAARAAEEVPGELSLWDRLGVLANKTGRTQAFVDALIRAVPPDGDSNLPAAVDMDLSERIATLYDEMLGEVGKATPYLERILARDPGNERAFARLKQLLTSLERWDALDALYERSVAAADPVRQADLLSEAALVAEEITGERAKATGYYERILEIDPHHEQATRALEMLYAAQDSWEKLAALLGRRLDGAAGDEALALRLRLGTLQATRLGDFAKALDHLEVVLGADPGEKAARDLVEQCLQRPELRARSAVVLEAAYQATEQPRELVRVLDVRLESAQGDEARAELLRRIAEIRDDRLNEDVAALDAYAKLVPISPDDENARARLLDIARRVGAHEQAADVLLAAAKNARAPQPRGEILMAVAKIFEDLLDAPSRAETVYREVLELDRTDHALALPAARALERIYAAENKPRELAGVLRVQVELEDDGDARRMIWGRLGEIHETSLDDPQGAIAAWRARAEDDPGDEQALASLDRLYGRTEQWDALASVLRSRERAATDRDQRKELMTRLALVLAERVNDSGEAILAYRAILDDFGSEHAVLAPLAGLYEKTERWDELAQTLESDLAISDVPVDKIELLARLGRVRRDRQDDAAGALEAFRQALTIDPSDAASRAALEAMLDVESVRRDAAAVLRPLYEADGEQKKLLRVLDIETELADGPSDRLLILSQAMVVAEQSLGDVDTAFAYASRGLREAAGEPELPAWIERAERLGAAANKTPAFVGILREVAPNVLDEQQQLDVLVKIAELSRDKLDDASAAREYFEKALQLRADDRRVLEALERLYESSGEGVQLLDVIKRRVDVADSDAERKALLYKQAKLCETSGDAESAITTYEQILDLALEREALDALVRLYTAASRWDDLVALYERQIGAGPSDHEKAGLHHALGRVASVHQTDYDRAFGEYEAALKLDPQHQETVASLEALMQGGQHAAQAAEMLESVYLAKLDWRRVMGTLDARLAVSQDPDERRHLLRRLAKLHEEQEENYTAALETTAKLLTEDVTDEATWHELERLARVANAEGRLADIYAAELAKVTADEPATAQLARRTGELYEAQKQSDRALEFYRRAYAFAPEESDGGVFEAIDRLLREANRPKDRVALYREALEYRDDPSLRLTTLHTIALLEESELSDDDAAIHTYQQALDLDETDVHSLEALSRLYARRERFKDLADLLRRRAEQAALPEDEARFRCELGQLLEKLGETSSAIDEYQNVVELIPPGAGNESAKTAVHALEALLAHDEHKARVVDILRPIYERADDWRHLVAVNGERLALANDDSEKVAIYRETAELWEQRGGDLRRAFDATREAFVLDPDDGSIRESLDRLAETTKRFDHLADAYEQGIARASDLGQRDLLSALGKLHDERRDDPRRALEAYERLFRLDENEIEPLEHLDELATLLSDWQALVRVLARKADLQTDDEQRAGTWRRIGEIKRDMLDDASGAIEAYERALEIQSDTPGALDALIALYEGKNDPARLVDLYRKRIDSFGADESDAKLAMMLASAERYEKGLDDRREAIGLLGEALAVKPGDAEVMRRLDRLYTAEEMWPELLENLRLQAAETQDEGERRELKKRTGALLASELDDPERALEAYREVLEVGPDDTAIEAVREIGESREELRLAAADVLEPVLRSSGRSDVLASVLEMRLRAQTDATDRARTLRAIAEVAENQLGDSKRAQDALHRALSEEPQDAELHAEIERVAEKNGADGWSRYATTLAERAGAIFDSAITTDLFMRLGKVSEEKLKDDARAAKAYAQAAENAGDSPEILASLDRLYSRLGDSRNLGEVIERRISAESDGPAQAELTFRFACLQLKEFGEKHKALGTLRAALERMPEHGPSREVLEGMLDDEETFEEAFEACEWVYRALGRADDLAKLYERRVKRASGVRERNRSRLDLARVLDEQSHDASRAQRVVEEAVLEDASDPDALAELERLAGVTGQWKEAADGLALALRKATDLPAQARTELWVKVAGWHREKTSDARSAEEAFSEARKLDPENTEVLRALEELQRAPGRERDLVETLRARAKLETDLSDKRTLLREAKGLAEGTLADAGLAEQVLRDLLAEDEGDLWALEELGTLRERAGAWSDVVDLLLRHAELEADGKTISDLRHRAARAAREHLQDDARAVKLYEELLENDVGDAEASSALRDLYGALGKRRDLAKLLQTLIDTAEGEEKRSSLRIELAKLQDAMGDSAGAIDTLRSVLEENRGHTEAVVALSDLLEKGGKDEELAELLNGQIEAARERGDAAGELALQVRLGEVYETRLKDAGKALATFEAVLERDANHHGALEAVARLAEGRSLWDKAAVALERLVAAETANPAAGVALALRLANAKEKLGDSDGVESALGSALGFESNNAEVRDRLRALYEKNKKWSELAAFLAEDATLLEAQGEGNGAAVVKLLRRAADIHAKQRSVAADAVTLLERAAKLAPQDRELLLALCDAYTAAGREKDAAEVLERIIASFGGKRSKELALYHHRLGRALAGLGDRAGALAQYDMAFKVDPGSVGVLRDLSMLSMESGDFDRAQKTFRALLLQKLDSNAGITKGEVFFYLGEISMKQGDKTKAIQMLERALENEPELGKAKSRLAEWKN